MVATLIASILSFVAGVYVSRKVTLTTVEAEIAKIDTVASSDAKSILLLFEDKAEAMTLNDSAATPLLPYGC